jgi:hypothetical protein
MEFQYDTRDLRFIVKEWLPAEALVIHNGLLIHIFFKEVP